MNINDTLKERELTYGDYADNAMIIQNLKDIIRCGKNYSLTSSAQRESIDMIVHKLGRIVNGDPSYMDSWHDIVGYAELAMTDMKERECHEIEITDPEVENDNEEYYDCPECEDEFEGLSETTKDFIKTIDQLDREIEDVLNDTYIKLGQTKNSIGEDVKYVSTATDDTINDIVDVLNYFFNSDNLNKDKK